MRTGKLCLCCFAVIALFTVLVPGRAFADGLTGDVTVEFDFPSLGSTFAGPVTVAVGSIYTCAALTTGLCSGAGYDNTVDLTAPLAITFATTPISPAFFLPSSFNGVIFSGLTFASGNPLADFTLAANTYPGLTVSDISFASSSISFNLAGLSSTGSFTLDLIPSPEPSSLLLLGTGLFGMLGAVRRKLIS